MKKRSLFFFVSAGCMILSLLISCSKKPSGNAVPNTASGGKAPYAEITVEVFDRGTDGGRSDPTKNNWTDWIQKKVLEEENIKVSFMAIPRANETTALNNMMAAGNPPDICLTYSDELISSYRDLGGLFDIAPYVDNLLPDLKEFLGPDLALPGRYLVRRYLESDTGKIFSLPARRMNVAHRNMFIRKDWLDKLGLPLPSTTQEFYETLKAFKEKDPGGVGKNNVIPWTMSRGVWFQAGNMLETFVDVTISDKDRWINTITSRSYLMPGYKEGVRFLNKMYNEGLIDRDFPLYSADEAIYSLIKSGMVGAWSQNWDMVYRDSPGIQRDLESNVPGALLVPCDPFTDANGVTYKNCHDAVGVRYFIPASSKNPEAALRYINWLARFENRLFLQIGPEGITHDVADGVPKLKAGTGLWIQNSPQNIDYTIMINGLDLGDPDLNAKGLANSYTVDPQLIVDAYEIAMNNAKPLPVVPVTLTAAGPYVQTLVDKGDVLTAEAITASPANFDRVWDAAIADWLASGAQAVRDERAAKYFEP